MKSIKKGSPTTADASEARSRARLRAALVFILAAMAAVLTPSGVLLAWFTPGLPAAGRLFIAVALSGCSVAALALLALDRWRKAARVAEVENRYHGLLEVTSEGIIISEATRDGERLVETTADTARMFGYTPAEMIGLLLLELIAPEERERFSRHIAADGKQIIETFGLRKDGTRFDIRMTTRLVRSSGHATRLIAVRDIAQRRAIEEALRQQTREMELLTQASQALTSTLDLNQVLAAILEEVCHLLNVTAASVWLIDPQTEELVCWQAVGPQSEIARGWRLARGEGVVGWVAANATPQIVYDTRADSRHFKGVDRQTGLELRSNLSVPLRVQERVSGVLQVMDPQVGRFQYTDLRLMESLAASAAIAIENARLYQEADRLRAFNENIVQNMSEGILLEDDKGIILFVNPKGAEILGYTPDELTGQPIHVGIAPDFRARVEQETSRRALGIASQYEAVLLKKDGQRVPVFISAQPLFEDGRFSGVLSVFTDITGLKEAEQEIRRRAAQQEALNAIIAAAAAAADLDELLKTVLDHTVRALRLEIGAIWVAGKWVIRGLELEEQQQIIQTVEAMPSGLSDTIAFENLEETGMAAHLIQAGLRAILVTPIRIKGEQAGALSVGDRAPRRWSAEEIGLVEAVGQQLGGVVERLQLLGQVQELALQMQQVVETVPAGILLLDENFDIVLANPAAWEHIITLCNVEEFGRPAPGQEMILTHLGGRPIQELLAPTAEGEWHEIVLAGPPRRIFNVAAYPVKSETRPKSWVMVLRDVTQEREIEARIQQQERLAVVGQLAAGIAHDFNNIMSVIILYTGTMAQRADIPPQYHEQLAIISQQARRASNLIQQILDFSRTSVMERKPLDLSPFLKELVKMLERMLPENIELTLKFGRDDYVVSADPTPIQQALMNLAVNARDAMPEGGRLTIELRRLRIRPGDPPPLPEMQAGDWVYISVADTGSGIPPDVLPYIFEPFFTTKPKGQGTGLGLAQVYGIIAHHEGHIGVETEVGRGSKFTLYLPALTEAEAGAVSDGYMPPADSIPSQGEGELILVVEDEAATREAIVGALELLGYRVLEAAHGGQALEIFRAHSREIALVLSDLTMPGLSGEDLVHELQRLAPHVKIIVMTGYPLDAADLIREGVRWLQKPLSVAMLSQAIKDIFISR